MHHPGSYHHLTAQNYPKTFPGCHDHKRATLIVRICDMSNFVDGRILSCLHKRFRDNWHQVFADITDKSFLISSNSFFTF